MAFLQSTILGAGRLNAKLLPLARRGLCAVATNPQRARRRRSLPSRLSFGGLTLDGGMGSAAFAGWMIPSRSATTAQAIQSSIQDPQARAKKYVITADDLSALLDKSPVAVRLFDVREPNEVQESGKISGAVNVPLTKLKAALTLDPAAFQTEYGAAKPSKDDTLSLVFYGLSSVKSTTALEIAYKLGYKKALHYPGGWEEWSTRNPAKV